MRSLNISTLPSSNTDNLKTQRLKWKEETSKRISVVVRVSLTSKTWPNDGCFHLLSLLYRLGIQVRPLSVREIKAGAKDVAFLDELNNECTLLVPKPTKMIAQVRSLPYN